MRRSCLVSLVVLAGSCLGAQTLPVQKVEGLKDVFQHGKVLVAGQPSLEMLRTFKSQGVGLVVNLRDEKEVKDHATTGFQMEATVKELGMAYLWLPLGDKASYTPAVVEKLGQAMKGQTGKVLIHCASGGRATVLYMAHLVRAGMPVEEALALGKQMKFTFPLEDLLGQPLVVRSK